MKHFKEMTSVDLDELTIDEILRIFNVYKENYGGNAVLKEETRYGYRDSESWKVWTIQVREPQ